MWPPTLSIISNLTYFQSPKEIGIFNHMHIAGEETSSENLGILPRIMHWRVYWRHQVCAAHERNLSIAPSTDPQKPSMLLYLLTSPASLLHFYICTQYKKKNSNYNKIENVYSRSHLVLLLEVKIVNLCWVFPENFHIHMYVYVLPYILCNFFFLN